MPNDFDTSAYPLGSTHPYVLYNNAGNEDLVVNDRVNETWVDRPPFNRVRKTFYGMEQDFARALAKMGYETVYLTYVDGSPLQVDRPTQLITRGTSVYAVKMPANFPLVLTGTWATDQSKLIDVGDASLRTFLASSGGSAAIGTAQGITLAQTLLERIPAHCHNYGVGLRNLKASIENPLEQITGLVYVGDSITWGVGATGASSAAGSTGGLNSPRDNASSLSWANIFRKYLQDNYLSGGTEVLSNWPTSPSGQCISNYTKRFFLYPRRGFFTLTQAAGVSLSATDTYNTNVEGTRQVLTLGNGNAGVVNSHTIDFQFTGTTFTLGFICQETTATYYDILINGVVAGTYSTHAGVDGFVSGTYNNYRTHVLAYQRNATITIRANRNGETGLREIYLQSIRIDKVLRVTNQGISGVATRFYVANNMGAFTAQDNHVITMLGTNDRIWQTTAPGTLNQFVYDYGAYLDLVTALPVNHTLMCANPAQNEDPAIYSFNMQATRGVIHRAAAARNLDMIDHYALFRSLPFSAWTADGLHPGALGHPMIANHLISAYEGG